MSRHLRMLTTLGALLVAISASQAGFAQKPGGVLRVHALDSPPSLSMHEEGDTNPARAAMGIFNNLVMFEGKRKNLVWEIERRLAEDGARPIIFYNRFAYCWQPQVKNWTMMVNSIINNFRMEDVWLDR